MHLHSSRKVIVFDTETTTLVPKCSLCPATLNQFPHIVQLGYVVFDTGTGVVSRAVSTYLTLPPGIGIAEGAQAVHKITPQICATQGRFIQSVLKEFMDDYLASDIAVCHNVAFDATVLRAELMRLPTTRHNTCQLDMFERRTRECTYCTMENTVNYCKLPMPRPSYFAIGRPTTYKWPKLEELHEKLFGCRPVQLHDAVNDAMVTARCYMKYTQNIDLCVMDTAFCEQYKKMIPPFACNTNQI